MRRVDPEMTEQWWILEEPTFTSNVPGLGRLIVWFRTLWNSVATKWYVRPLLQQQNQVNHRLITMLYQLQEEREVLQAQLISLDREAVDARRDLSHTFHTLQEEIERLRKRVAALEREVFDQKRSDV